MLWLVQTTGVAVGEVDGDAVGVGAAVGLVDTPGSEQEARIDVAAATATSPGAVLRIPGYTGGSAKRGRTTA
jgi:hypothetical protein